MHAFYFLVLCRYLLKYIYEFYEFDFAVNLINFQLFSPVIHFHACNLQNHQIQAVQFSGFLCVSFLICSKQLRGKRQSEKLDTNLLGIYKN